MKPDIGSESRFPPPYLYSMPQLGGGGPSKYCYNVWYRKIRMVWLPEGKKCEDMFIRFDRMYERDRHTYRQTDRQRMTVKALRSQKNIAGYKKRHASYSTLALYQSCCKHNGFQPSHSVYNSWEHPRFDDGRAWLTTAVVWRQVEQQAVLILNIYFSLKPEYPRMGASEEEFECDNWISGDNFLTVFHSNHGSI